MHAKAIKIKSWKKFQWTVNFLFILHIGVRAMATIYLMLHPLRGFWENFLLGSCWDYSVRSYHFMIRCICKLVDFNEIRTRAVESYIKNLVRYPCHLITEVLDLLWQFVMHVHPVSLCTLIYLLNTYSIAIFT